MQKIIVLITCLLGGIFITYLGYNLIYQNKMPMKNFSKAPLSQAFKQDMIKKNIWSPKCPVFLDRLNILKVSYIDFDGNEHDDGNLVVLDVAADHVLSIFKQLYENKFPISSVNLINEYKGNDEKSMEDNNSSAFNCRNIPDSKVISIHSYGLAIDINPLQNPYLITNYQPGKTNIDVFPPQGMEYINRRNIRAGMMETIINSTTKTTAVDVFKQNGFTIWGGNWNDPIDWHHFQVTRKQAETLAQLSYDDGAKFFNEIVSGKN